MNLIEKKVLGEVLQCIAPSLDHFEQYYQQQLRNPHAFLQPVLDYLGFEEGKRLRPALCFLTHGLYAAPDTKTVPLAVIVELLHMASLVHDDVVDHSGIRRGRHSINAVWGNKVAVLLGDYLFAKILTLAVRTDLDTVTRIGEAVIQMGEGELRQVLDSPVDITRDVYLDIIRKKTARLFGLACEFGGLAASVDAPELNRLTVLGESIGMAFQIQDDILDFAGNVEKMGKPVRQDIHQGVVSAPLVFAMENMDPESRRLKMHTWFQGNGEYVKEVHDFIRERDGISLALHQADMYRNEAMRLLAAYPASQYREGIEKILNIGAAELV